MTQQILEKTYLAGYTGKNHQLITKEKALGILSSTEFKGYRTFVYGMPIEQYPENYFFTTSSFEHIESHVKCGTPFSVNGFFINEKGETLSLATVPVGNL